MVSVIKKIVSYLKGENDTSEELEDEAKIISAIESINLQSKKESCVSVFDSTEEAPLGKSDPVVIRVKKFELIHKTGKITHLSNEYGLIDYVIYFVPSQVSSSVNLKKNDEVLYTAYKAKDNETERVYKIYGLKKDSWDYDTEFPDVDEKCPEKQDVINGIIRHIVGRVTKRKGREMYIDTIEMWCNLDKIQTSFIPVEGDWLSVQAVVVFDENVTNFVGDVIEIISIKPLLEKSNFGRVTLWSLIKNKGAIENSVFFTALECEQGYIPSLGDQVVYDAIESDQDSFKWRALAVYPYSKDVKKEIKKKCYNNSKPTYNEGDCEGISVTPILCAVEVELNQRRVICFEIANNGPVCRPIKSISLDSNQNSQLEITNKPKKNYLLKPQERVEVYLMCRGRFLGLSGETCFFRFEKFTLARKIEIQVSAMDKMDGFFKIRNDEVAKVSPEKQAKQIYQKSEIVTYGPRVWQPPKFVSRERKYVFTLPKRLQDIVYKKMKGEKKIKAIEEYAPYLKFDLNFAHYADRFHMFLFLEEIELRINFEKYNLDRVHPLRVGDFFSLKVPALVERRPSIIVGDSVILTQPWCEGEIIEHVGFVHEILKQEVLIKFHGSFHDSYDGSECNVRFLPNTFFFARCHEAVNRAEKVLGEKWLFPSSVSEKPVQINFDHLSFTEEASNLQVEQSEPSELGKTDESGTDNVLMQIKAKKKVFFKWMNKNLNERQKLAVMNVLKGQGRPLPYIIFGPPGTGKTVTLVEIILQIYMLIPESRILVTTPSNNAADLICTRLIEMAGLKPGQLIRLTAVTRILEGRILPHLRAYTSFYKVSELRSSNLKGAENLRLCSMNELTGKHRITVSTCSNVGRLHFLGFGSGHFTHIVVDEAGQTLEPEVLISATFQNIESGQMVLAGDPQQLGPVVCSSITKHYKFDESLLERFSKRFPYAKDMKSFPNTSGYDPRFITRLNVNYRSVPEILSLPSQMFYNSDLVPTVSSTEGFEASIIEKFNFMGDGRDKPAALIFHGIIGMNYQEPDSPSWFNPQEIWQVLLYLKKLYSIGLTSSDVGILTPYAKQVSKLQDLMHSLNLHVPKVGTVDEFQGQENNVIILSTVRSTLRELKIDILHHLGFVACPKRLNVSLTRARAMLIIVGNPVLLSHDPYWCSVIKYCIQNKSYTGCNLKYFNYNLVAELNEGDEKREEEEEEEEEKEEKEEGKSEA